ncbi:hypothetical protein [Thermophilibacter sp.]
MKAHVTRILRRLVPCVLILPLAAALASCAPQQTWEPPVGAMQSGWRGSSMVSINMLVSGYSWDGGTADVVDPATTEGNVPHFEVGGTETVRVHFSQPATEVEVSRRAEGADAAEPVAVSAITDEGATLEVEPGWRYVVSARFEDGSADYLIDVVSGGSPAEGYASTALVAWTSGDQVLFIDQATESPYLPTLPEGTPALAAGNVVRVTGNGIMLESYPAQYPGITQVEVIEEGAPEDAEKYAELVAQLWPPKDPAEPPSAAVEYQTELASVTLTPLTCGYTWSYDSEGERRTASADAPHPTQLEAADVPYATVDGPTKVTVRFDVPATAAGIVRWRESDLAAAAREAGSAAAVELGAVDEDILSVNDREVADGAVTLTVEPGWRYSVETWFDDGTAIYVFTVTDA